MSRLNTLGALAVAALIGSAACTAPTSSTDLNPAGPPMVRQVMMSEEYLDASNVRRTRALSLAFGHHDDPAFMNDDGKVVAAVVDPTGQKIRIVMDELLVGNSLELVQCRGPVNANAPLISRNYSRVPIGTTPDDIAKCSGSQDLIQSRCNGEHAVCINNTGSVVITDQGGASVMPGDPVGIEDQDPPPDGDGVPDKDLFIDGAVRIVCTGADGKSVDAPLDLAGSYWQPSGNQQVPAHGGVAELGPALVLNLAKGLPTNSQCTFKFDPSVTDKDGNLVCAPPDGDVTQSCPGDGDTSLIKFGTTNLRVENTQPQGTGLMTTRQVVVTFNSLMDEASLAAGITITENGTSIPFTVTRVPDSFAYTLVVTLKAASTYVVTIHPTVADWALQPMGGADVTYMFTTM